MLFSLWKNERLYVIIEKIDTIPAKNQPDIKRIKQNLFLIYTAFYTNQTKTKVFYLSFLHVFIYFIFKLKDPNTNTIYYKIRRNRLCAM